MPTDFITADPNSDPTQGLQEAAPIAPAAPQSSLLDTVRGDLLHDSQYIWSKIQNSNAEHGFYDARSAQQIIAPEAKIPVDQARKQFPGLKVNEDLPLSVLQSMQKDKQNEDMRADVNARYPATWAAFGARFGAGLVTGLLDPVDDAAFMVPVVGEARYAGWLARAGEEAGMAGRAAVAVGTGALRGAAGMGIIDIGKAATGDPDMTLGQAAFDTLQGALMGGALHGVTAFRHDIMGYRFGATPEGQAAMRNAQTHDDATRVAAAQMAYGNPVEVRPVFDEMRNGTSRGDLMSGTALGRTLGAPDYLENAVAEARGRPDDDQVRAADVARQAKTTPPDKVVADRMAEAESQIEALRASGELTPEEEALLAEFEPKEREKQTGKAAEGTAAPTPPVIAAEDAKIPLPDVMGDHEIRFGAQDSAVTASGREVPVQYGIVDAGRLVASHDADGNVNPQYPAELQPRDRARGTSSAQISKMAATLDPRLLMETPKASDGAPIISPRGVVESGNGRTLAIRRAYAEHPEVAARYRKALEAKGYDTSGMEQPMLVRMRHGMMKPEDVEAFTREANARDTLAYSATEQAQADARALPDQAVALYRGGDIDAAGNRDFVKAFMTHAVPAAEHGAMTSTDGALSQQAIQRIRAALLAKAYGDADLIAGIVESTDSNTKAIGGALTDAVGAWAKMRQGVRDGHVEPTMDITRNLLDAVRLIERARKDGESVHGLVRQRDIFSGETVDPLTEAVLRLMFRKEDFTGPVGRERLAGYLTKYTDEAMKAAPGPDLLGLSSKVEPSDILGIAKGRETDETAQQDIFRPAGSAGDGERPSGGGSDRPAGEGVPGEVSGQTAGNEPADGSLGPTLTTNPGGKGITLTGATPEQVAAIRAALPNASIQETKDGGLSLSAKHADTVRAVLGQETPVPMPTPERTPNAPEHPTYGSKNKTVTQDEYAKIRQQIADKMNPNRLNAGLDPELALLGARAALYHIEAGARSFVDYAHAIMSDLGEIGITPAMLRSKLRAWYNAVRDEMEDEGQSITGMDSAVDVAAHMANFGELEKAVAAGRPGPELATGSANVVHPVVAALRDRFIAGERFNSIVEARKAIEELTGESVKPGTPEAKRADEMIESAVVQAARHIALTSENPIETYRELVDLYSRQPNLNVRSSTSIEQQAYSTPVPLAYLASERARIGPETTVYEPTAGNGALLIGARDGNITANELNADRAEQLRGIYPDASVTEHDATTFVPEGGKRDVVIANPPFGPLKGPDGENKVFDLGGGYKTREIDHAIALRALDAMKDDGRAVLIVGSIAKTITGDKARGDAYNGKAKREFYYRLYSQYNVTDHFTVAGELYSRQGAAWPVDVIVIEGMGKSALRLPAVNPPRVFDTWAGLENEVERGQSVLPGTGAGDGEADKPIAPPTGGDGGTIGSGGVGRPDPEQERLANEQPDVVRDGPDAGQPTGDRLGERDVPVQTGLFDAPKPDQGSVPDRRPAEIKNEALTGDDAPQVPYKPASNSISLDTLVPTNMRESATAALNRLQARVGNVDHFVADKLGYGRNEISQYFSAEQVDALALALDNMEQGKGFIIGDQTGIGKGRVVAGVIRYAIKEGRMPIFVTEKPGLYSDMYRDMTDIGLPEMLGRPVNILMTNASQTVPLDENGLNVLKTPAAGTHNRTLMRVANGDRAGVDALFTTYSQMQAISGEETPRQAALKAMAPGSILIFDESHNAGGQGEARPKSKKEQAQTGMNRAEFARKLAADAHGVFFSSATYAKRPNVMDLYASTDMRLAVADIKKLGEAISKGGIPMQQIVAKMLAESGQYVRRERSFAGIEYRTPQVAVDRKAYGQFANVLNAIQQFQEHHISDLIAEIHENVKNEASAISLDGSVGGAGATSTNFTSVMHNLVEQMLVALKADPAAEMAIDALKNGEKPVITLANTMGSFIEEYASEHGISNGGELPADFSALLHRYLDRTRHYTIKKPFSEEKGEKHYISDAQMGPAALAAFRRITAQIREMDMSNVPVSPIDHIRQKLMDAGYKVGEITGRTHAIDYSGDKPSLRIILQSERSITGKRGYINGFNNGGVDAMILNQAGSTGLSLHASVKFKDQRPRRMIIAQAERNIDTHMQMLGRVHRTGQVVLPSYDQLVAAVPAEMRPAAALSKKMASLNANTTGARGSAMTGEDVPDFMNEFGDEIAARMMEENPELYERLLEPLADGKDGYEREDAARKVTGKLTLLPLEDQEKFYEEFLSEYRDYLAQKEATGEASLEAKTLPLDAKLVNSQMVVPATDPHSPFGAPVNLETLDVKRLGKPMQPDAVLAAIAGHVGSDVPQGGWEEARRALTDKGKQTQAAMFRKAMDDFATYRSETLDGLTSETVRESQTKRLDDNASDFRKLSHAMYPGAAIRMTDGEGVPLYGVVMSIERKPGARNPIALGSYRAKIALADAASQVTMPFSQLRVDSMAEGEKLRTILHITSIDGEKVMDAFANMQHDSRERRVMMTGNILAAFDHTKGKGQIVNFIDHEGNMRSGLMMRRGYNYAQEQASQPVVFRTPEHVVQWIRQGGTATGDGVMVTARNGRIEITAAASKSDGGKYFLDQRVRQAIGRYFFKSSKGMVAEAPLDDARKIVQALQAKGANFRTTTDLERARAMVNDQGAGGGAIFRDIADGPVSQKQFGNWVAHIDLQGRKDGTGDATRAEVERNGFSQSRNVNALPPHMGGEAATASAAAYVPRAGDTVYLVPPSGYKDGPNGAKINVGWKPGRGQVVKVEYDGQSLYDLYRQAFDDTSHRDIDKPMSDGNWYVQEAKDRAFGRAFSKIARRWDGIPDDAERGKQILPAMRRAVSDLRDGKINYREFQNHIEDILDKMETRRAEQSFGRDADRARGVDYVRQRLLEAKRRGDITPMAADMAEWLIQKNPALFDELGISIRKPNERGTAGMYNPIERIMTLFKGSTKDTTAVHEMLHHLETVMPAEAQAAIRNEWSKAITAEMIKADPKMQDYLEHVLAANELGSGKMLEAAREKLPSADAYQFLNPSEFWAVNATRIMASRFDAQSGIGARLRQWFGELVQRVRGWLGLRSDAPMLRTLADVFNNRVDQPTDQMLSKFSAFHDVNDQPAADPTEQSGEQDPAAAAILAKQKLTALQDIVKRKANMRRIDAMQARGLTLVHGLDSLTRGISEAVPGARDSTAQHQLANQEFLMGRLVANLEAIPGGMEAWRGATLTHEWVQELAELNKKDGSKPGISKSPLALELAKAVHDAQDMARLNLNRAGAWIGDYDGYVSRTQHDAIKIHNAGYEQWSRDVMQLLDKEKTFADLIENQEGFTDPADTPLTFDQVDQEEVDDYLRNTWDALSTGVHMSSDHGVDPKAAAFGPGSGNMAKQKSAARVLHWKDADSWRMYQEKYGDPVIERGVMETLYRAGRDTALMERWGSNPKLAFETLIQQVRQKYRSDHDALSKFDKALPRIREEFAHLTGEAMRPQSAMASQIRGSILAMQDITKLGNVLLAHLSTSLTKPFQLQYLGVGRWRSYFSVLSNLAKDKTPEGKQLLENLRANATGQFQDMIGGYEPVDGVPGQLARLRQFSMRIGGLPWMLARQKAGAMWEIANFLGQSVDKPFNQLDERTARGMTIYGITPAEWEVLRTAPNHDRDAAGSTFLTPAAATRANIDPLIGDKLRRARDDEDAKRIRAEARDRLAMKLSAYYADAADRSTVTPGVQERAFFSRHAGRTWGPVVGQYKGWAMAAVRTMWGQSIKGSGSRAEAVKYLAELGAVGMAVGFARLAITDAANGLEPDLPNGDFKHDAMLTSKAMIAGGALGIIGDYMMGQYARAGEGSADRAKDLALNLLGPAFADIAQTYGLVHEFGAIPFANDASHALDRADADGMHFLTAHLPLANTFYLRLLSRWLVLDQLNEMADPGYLARHMNAVQQRTGQEFYLPPTNYAGAA